MKTSDSLMGKTFRSHNSTIHRVAATWCDGVVFEGGPAVSTEDLNAGYTQLGKTTTDQQAYQAGQNITQLGEYKKQHNQLRSIEDKLASEVLLGFPDQSLPDLAYPIQHGWDLLRKGHRYEDALASAMEMAGTPKGAA